MNNMLFLLLSTTLSLGSSLIAMKEEQAQLGTNNSQAQACSWQHAKRVTLEGNAGPFNKIVTMPGNRLLTSTTIRKNNVEEDTCHLWNTVNGKKLATYKVEHFGSRAISADGTKIALEEPDHALIIVDGTNGQIISRIPGNKKYYCLAFNKQGNSLFTSSWDQITAIWNVHNGTLISQLDGHINSVVAGQFNNEGTRVLTISTG